MHPRNTAAALVRRKYEASPAVTMRAMTSHWIRRFMLVTSEEEFRRSLMNAEVTEISRAEKSPTAGTPGGFYGR